MCSFALTWSNMTDMVWVDMTEMAKKGLNSTTLQQSHSLVPIQDLISSLIKKWIQMENGTTYNYLGSSYFFTLRMFGFNSIHHLNPSGMHYSNTQLKKTMIKNTKAQCDRCSCLWLSFDKKWDSLALEFQLNLWPISI